MRGFAGGSSAAAGGAARVPALAVCHGSAGGARAKFLRRGGGGDVYPIGARLLALFLVVGVG